MNNDPLMKSSPLTIREALQRVLTAAEALPVPAEGFYATWHGVLDDARAALAAHDYARQLRQTYPARTSLFARQDSRPFRLTNTDPQQ
jgi:hypothetical protein